MIPFQFLCYYALTLKTLINSTNSINDFDLMGTGCLFFLFFLQPGEGQGQLHMANFSFISCENLMATRTPATSLFI